MEDQPLASNPVLYVALIGLFIWLIPMWHALRSGSLLAAMEVMVLLALGVAAPVMALFLTRNLGDIAAVFRTLGAIQAIGASALLWLGALLIALAADLGREFRRVERRRGYGGPVAVEPGRPIEPRV